MNSTSRGHREVYHLRRSEAPPRSPTGIAFEREAHDFGHRSDEEASENEDQDDQAASDLDDPRWWFLDHHVTTLPLVEKYDFDGCQPMVDALAELVATDRKPGYVRHLMSIHVVYAKF